MTKFTFATKEEIKEHNVEAVKHWYLIAMKTKPVKMTWVYAFISQNAKCSERTVRRWVNEIENTEI